MHNMRIEHFPLVKMLPKVTKLLTFISLFYKLTLQFVVVIGFGEIHAFKSSLAGKCRH